MSDKITYETEKFKIIETDCHMDKFYIDYDVFIKLSYDPILILKLFNNIISEI